MKHGEWCGADVATHGKEPLDMLKTLQGNPAGVQLNLLLQLSALTGVDQKTVQELIHQIRTNAAVCLPSSVV